MRFHRSNLTVMIVGLLLLALLGNLPQSAQAQTSVSKIVITQVDTRAFPNIQVTALLRDGNNKPMPLGDLKVLQLSESVSSAQKREIVSDDIHGYTTEEVDAGIEAVFVFDIAGNLASAQGKSGTSIYAEMTSVAQTFFDSMSAADTAAILYTVGDEAKTLQAITSDKAALSMALKDLPKSGENLTRGNLAITAALAELGKSPRRGQVVQTIIFMTTGLTENQEQEEALLNQAQKNSIYIHTLLHRDYNYSTLEPVLQKIATDTLGSYAYYRNSTSTEELHTWLAAQRKQVKFQFRSTFGDSTERQIEIRTIEDVGSAVVASATYQVAVESPLVVIDSPTNNQEIVRAAAAYDSNLDEVLPTSQSVAGSVIWPDNFKRDIATARFYVDGKETGAPLTPEPGSVNLAFDWDLKPFRQAGQYTAKLRIEVDDEFGLTGSSDEVLVNIAVTVPPLPAATAAPPPTAIPTATPACYGLEKVDMVKCQAVNITQQMLTTPSGWISIVSLVIAIVAVAMAIHFRGQIVQAGGQFVDVVRETVTRLTRPVNSEAGAFLEVARGDDELLGKRIPLYMRTVTPAGRSPQEAELVFHLGVERSVISRKHCEFREEDGIFKIRDLGSAHGTFLNGTRLPDGGAGQVLQSGDKIELGPAERGGVLLIFHMAGSEPTDQDNNDDENYVTKPAYS
jgi:hypothetical protein